MINTFYKKIQHFIKKIQFNGKPLFSVTVFSTLKINSNFSFLFLIVDIELTNRSKVGKWGLSKGLFPQQGKDVGSITASNGFFLSNMKFIFLLETVAQTVTYHHYVLFIN